MMHGQKTLSCKQFYPVTEQFNTFCTLNFILQSTP